MFTEYSDYKKTDHDWIGNIPLDWEIKRVGHHVDFLTGFAFKSEFFSFEEGIKIVRGDNVTEGALRWGDKTRYWPSVTKELEIYLLKDKDILIGMDGSKVGKNFTVVYERDLPLLLVQRVARLRVDEYLDYKFLAYLISSELFRTWVSIVKTDPAIPHISPADIKGFPLPFPSLFEQQQIANFLDHETAKIDTLIEQQQQLIQLLKEKRQAVISHAVTKGLNPDAPMKDSGVEWLGEVPEHWEVKPLKFLLSDKKGSVKAGPFGSHLKNSDMEGNDVKVISQKNVISKDFNIGELMISEEKYRELSGFTIERNDILISTRGTIGRAAVYLNDEIAILHPCLIRIQVDLNRVFPKFVELLIEDSGYVLEQILINSNSTTIEVIYSENLINTVVCLPNNLIEQREILNYVIQKKEYFDSSISKAQQAIELMQERRTALISAAVTGKIDVRNWQAPQQ